MKNIPRPTYLKNINELLSEKNMLFLAGPRQAGKTTLANQVADKYKNKAYLNWDILTDKQKVITDPTFFQTLNRQDDSKPLVIFDEIHKYKKWKNYLKGIYDEFNYDYRFLISGSGRLDIYQKDGDSLAGRYLMLHLFPFTLSELAGQNLNFANFIKNPLQFKLSTEKKTQKIWKRLQMLSGFPDPYTQNKQTFWFKWSNNYVNQIIREDIRDLSGIKNIDNASLLFSLLPLKVGSPLSINNLANDLQVSFDTVKNWLNLFDLAYLTFRLSPWSRKIARAISKEKKIYLFNYPFIKSESIRFENMIALELYKAIFNWNELGYGHFNLHYLKNKEKEEVDFLITQNNNPFLLIEAKYSDLEPAKSLLNFQDILNIPAIQLVNQENIFKLYKNNQNKILIATAHQWLAGLP